MKKKSPWGRDAKTGVFRQHPQAATHPWKRATFGKLEKSIQSGFVPNTPHS